MPLALLGIVGGLVLLTIAAEHFVLGAARTASVLKLSPVVIGAVVIGFGTSAPEMVVSGIAAGRGQLDIAVGNVIGSNVANLSLVLGAAALVTSISVASTTLRREAPLSLLGVLLFAVLVQGGLTRTEGLILLFALVLALGNILVGSSGQSGDDELTEEVAEYLDGSHEHPLSQEIPRAIAGLIGTLIAAQVLVASATTIASEMGLGEGFIGLTIVALGTSLPELATSLQAARKGETDLIIGNLLGSNLFNSLAVGGLAAVIGPGALQDSALAGLGTFMMVGIAVAATAFMVTGNRVTRNEGLALLAGYAVMVPLLA